MLLLKASPLVACLALPLLWTCASKKEKEQPKEVAASKLSAEEQKQLDQARAEMEVGRNMAGRLLKYYGAYPDDKLVRYVNEVGAYVSKYSDYPERRYMFEVYYAEEVNAFACPGGYILVSLGAIKNASNEAELAHVLGHEITHVGKRHMFDALSKMNEEELKKEADKGAKWDEQPAEVKIRRRPDPEDSALAATIARYMGGSSAGLNILQAAKAGMSMIMEKGLGSELEYEADKEGTRFAINAGYAPKALINFLCRIETNRGKPQDFCLQKQDAKAGAGASVLEKTHPPIPDRVASIKKVLIDLKAGSIVGAKGKKRYLQIKERIKGVDIGTSNEVDAEPETKE